MTAKKQTGPAAVLFLALVLSAPSMADEILFQNPDTPQTGVVMDEDDQSVTIRFHKSAIKSMTRSGQAAPVNSPDQVIWEKGRDYYILKIPRRSIRMVPSRTDKGPAPVGGEATVHGQTPTADMRNGSSGRPEEIPSRRIERTPASKAKLDTQQELLREEMGRVQGSIWWRGAPLVERPVKIVLERYTGFSLAALNKLFLSGNKASGPNPIMLQTRTDSQGRYAFPEAPPGTYRLYWMPDKKTGWIRRLREAPDIDVNSASLTVADIPAKKNKGDDHGD